MSVLTRLSALVVATVAVAAVGAAAKAPGSALEFAVKASYLTKFGPFIHWPPGAIPDDGPAQICLVGADPFGAMIDAAAQGQQIDGHPLTVARMDAVDAKSAASCQIMFVGKPTAQSTADTLHAAAGLPVLTVTDRSRGVAGGIIEFVISDGRVRFDIDQGAADADGLQISAKLLALAVAVRR
jgi:hypothetical protein